MSDYRAIAAATATLQNQLLAAVREEMPGATVASGPPPAKAEHEFREGLINVFLYKVEPNPVWRNEELPYRRSDGTLSDRPQLALDLYFLLSFYGDDSKQVPNLLLGAALSALHAEPYPPAHYMPRSAAGEDVRFGAGSANLADSGLSNQRHSFFFTLLSGEQDEVIRTWTQLLQTTYVLSVAYIGRVVLIEPNLVPEPALPARRVAVHPTVARQPRLDALDPPSLVHSPDAELRLHGRGLGHERVRVEIGEQAVEPVESSQDELSVLLPANLTAGVHLVRVAHGHRLADSAAADAGSPDGDRKGEDELRWDIASNPLALVLSPRVLDLAWKPAPVSDPRPGVGAAGLDGREVLLGIRFAPPVSTGTAIGVLLNRSPSPDSPTPTHRGYQLHAVSKPNQPDSIELTATIAPGRYLVRLRIGGAESPLEVDHDPTSPSHQRYVGPSIEIPAEAETEAGPS